MRCAKCGKELKEVFWQGNKPYGPKCFSALVKSKAVWCEQEDLFQKKSPDEPGKEEGVRVFEPSPAKSFRSRTI